MIGTWGVFSEPHFSAIIIVNVIALRTGVSQSTWESPAQIKKKKNSAAAAAYVATAAWI